MSKATKTDPKLFSLVIYQNGSFIDGLYHSLYGPKVSSTEVENSKDSEKSGALGVSGGADVSILKKGLKLNADGSASAKSSQVNRTTEIMSYAQSYYLHKVREKFYSDGVLRKLDSNEDFKSLVGSDFVEFKATFEKNDLISLLDMVSPQLGGSISFSHYVSSHTGEQYDQNQAAGQFEIGKSVVETLQKEFRNETSSEFYGKIIGSSGQTLDITSVLICDKEFFANEDKDRLLDGEFTVLGKVIMKTKDGISKFERNKLLKRIKYEGKKKLIEYISEQKELGSYIDTSIEFDIEGNIIKVIPIAIYV